jgi:hypothetical protein
LVAIWAAASASANGASILRGLDEPGLAARDNDSIGVPPDPTAAVSRDHFVQTVNTRIAVYDRELDPVSDLDAHRFWHRPETVTMVDPQIAWDSAARRWYYAMVVNRGTGPNELMLAWSKTEDPSDLERGWCRHSIPTGALFDDFPKLGYSANHIIIGTNVADLGEGRLLFARIWAIGKPAPGDESCARPPISSFGSMDAPLRQADGLPAFTPVPVSPRTPSKRGYVVSSDCLDDDIAHPSCGRDDRTGRGITVWHVEGPRAAPTLVRDGGIPVPTFSLAKPIPLPGTKVRTDPSDTRLFQAISAPDPTRGIDDAIWTQHAVRGRRGRSEIHWYELDPGRLSVVRGGEIAKRRNWVFNGAVSPTWRGNRAVINFNVAGRRLLPKILARSRGPGDGKHAMGGEITLARSASVDTTCTEEDDDVCAWGDYAAAVPDPVKKGVVWGSNERMARPGRSDSRGFHWATRNLAIRARR